MLALAESRDHRARMLPVGMKLKRGKNLESKIISHSKDFSLVSSTQTYPIKRLSL